MPLIQTPAAIVSEDGGMSSWSPQSHEAAEAQAASLAAISPGTKYFVVPVRVFQVVEEETP